MTCKIEDCDRNHHAQGFCLMHYRRVWRTGSPHPKTQARGAECSVEGCTKKVHGKNLCKMHYMRLRRNGSIETSADHEEAHVCLECGKKAVALSLCAYHYHEWAKYRVAERHTIPTRPWLIAYQSRTGVLHMQSWVLIRGKRTLVAGCNLRLSLNPNSKRKSTKPCMKCRHVLKEHGLLD